MNRRTFLYTFLAVGFAHISCAESLIVNGELTGTIPATNGTVIPSVPLGWSAGRNNIDMYHSGGRGYFGELLPASPGGTQFVAAVGGSTQSQATDESFFQVLDGIQVGNTYRLSFYQANLGLDSTSHSFSYTSPGQWEVRFGDDKFFAPAMPFLGFGADDFSLVVAEFTVASAPAKLEFVAHDNFTTNNFLSYLAIDDISLTLVPETSIGVLLFGAYACCDFRAPRKRRKQTEWQKW